MIESSLYAAFIVLSAGIIVLPGPNVLFIVATSLSGGRRTGLFAVAGTSTAMAVQLGIAATGTTALASVVAGAFIWIKWAGVAYLGYLGLMHLMAARRDSPQTDVSASAQEAYWRGFLVSLTNPKTILFFGAFLPQFVSGTQQPGLQLAILSVSFLFLAVVLDSIYALSASAVIRLVSHPACEVRRNTAVGLLYLGASLGLAVARRTDA